MTAFLRLRRGMLVAGVALTAALAAGTVGCGSDDEGTAATGADGADTTSVEADPPAPPTKAEYIAAADEICTRFDKKQEVFKVRSKLTDQIVASQSTEGADEVADAVDAVADQRQDLTDALRELEPRPAGPATTSPRARSRSKLPAISPTPGTTTARARRMGQRSTPRFWPSSTRSRSTPNRARSTASRSAAHRSRTRSDGARGYRAHRRGTAVGYLRRTGGCIHAHGADRRRGSARLD